MGRKHFEAEEIIQHLRTVELETENARLKKIVANQAVEVSILKEVALGNF